MTRWNLLQFHMQGTRKKVDKVVLESISNIQYTDTCVTDFFRNRNRDDNIVTIGNEAYHVVRNARGRAADYETVTISHTRPPCPSPSSRV